VTCGPARRPGRSAGYRPPPARDALPATGPRPPGTLCPVQDHAQGEDPEEDTPIEVTVLLGFFM
jgi:hypothetical protein